MDIKVLETALKEIEKNVRILENSKFEHEKKLILNGENVKCIITKSELKNLFSVGEDKKSVRDILKCSNFSENVKCIEFNGGIIILK